MILFIILITIAITVGGIAVCYFFVSKFLKNKKINFLVAFMIFGLLIGIWSFQAGKRDLVFIVNFPGSYISEIAYNDYLIPYWKKTLKPARYESIPIIKLSPMAPSKYSEPGKKEGMEIMPIYDFPIKKVSDLYILASLLFWGIVGLTVQLSYNAKKT